MRNSRSRNSKWHCFQTEQNIDASSIRPRRNNPPPGSRNPQNYKYTNNPSHLKHVGQMPRPRVCRQSQPEPIEPIDERNVSAISEASAATIKLKFESRHNKKKLTNRLSSKTFNERYTPVNNTARIVSNIRTFTIKKKKQLSYMLRIRFGRPRETTLREKLSAAIEQNSRF